MGEGNVELEQPKSGSKRKKSLLREITEMLLCFVIVIIAAFLIVKYVGQRTIVNGQSMENTLSHGDNLIQDKISYRFKEPVRYDIIIFPFKYKEDTHYIKRIIGLPGETIQIAGGMVFINGEALGENYGKEVMESPGIAAVPIELGKDEYFVLGDNRNNSSDSRDPSVGVIKREEIEGKAWLRIWPLSEFGILKHQ